MPNRSIKVTYIITEACVDQLDRTCVGECPVDCIYEGERMLYIQPDECVDCGACEPVCPVGAIYLADDVPAESRHYQRVNAEFFTNLGSPGGAAGVGKIHGDHPVVATVPPQPKRF
jgi:NAD-dependent dihydropyrimidine dehydrogenase PreA subunit